KNHINNRIYSIKSSSLSGFGSPSSEISDLSQDRLFATQISPAMTRGSQRERDRERALARTGGKGKNKDDGLTPEQRRERDAKALQEKTAKKAAQAAAAASSGGGGGKGNNK
ncbi:protein family SERF N-terminal protein, partial [Arabidopsis suecica]